MIKTKVDLNKIYSLFFGKNLVDLAKLETTEVEPKTPTKPQSVEPILTPMSKKIYDVASPKSKPYVLQDLLKNDAAIRSQENKENIEDPDYQEKMENNGLGFFMENIVSIYGRCPICGERMLKKYAQSNVPIVDLVCVNSEFHLKNVKCFLYQLKISLTNDYFSLKDQKISVGSKIYGEPTHLVKGDSSVYNKIVVPGYICIKLYLRDADKQVYDVDYRNSFVLVPDYNNTKDEYYYQYSGATNRYGKNVITWNASMVSTIPLKYVFDRNNIVYEVFGEKEIANPYAGLKPK